MGNYSSCSPSTKDGEQVPHGDFHSKYLLGKKLGKGAFAQVYLVSDANEERAVNESGGKAVKIVDIRGSGNQQEVSKLQKGAYNETKVWATVGKHAHVVQLLERFYDAEFCYMVMEKCAFGLFQYVEQAPELNERFIGDLMVQMLCGISHVNSARVVHRDIKPDNFLVGGVDGQTVKLSDFGLSAALPVDGYTTGIFGTAPFMSPEMLKNRKYDGRADIWSMGVLAYALLFGDFPYKPEIANSQAMKKTILDGKTPSFRPTGDLSQRVRSEPAMNFVMALLNRSLDKRPTAEDALNMTYMVKCAENRHMQGVSLPSLRPMLHAAKKHGAFDIRDVTKENGIDGILRKMQMEQRRVLGTPKHHEKNLLSSPSSQSAFSVKSSGLDSLKANDWTNASSVSTTASSASSIPSLESFLETAWTPVNSQDLA